MLLSLNEIKNITEEKINSLKVNQVAEDKQLEYKLTLPGEKYDDKKEFLADASSFANADGGVIFYGIGAKGGVPEDISGLVIDNTDAEILRLENILRTSIEPRLIGVVLHPFKLLNGNYLIAAYIPKSFNPPHVVNFQGHWKFYSRNSAGKYPLEVSEIKSIISLSSTAHERIGNFRLERISRIKNRELPIPISDEPKFIYHLIPLSSFATDASIDLAKFERANFKYELFYNLPKIYNYEGILIHNQKEGYNTDFYVQIFRNGAIEVYVSYLHNVDKQIVPRNSFEIELIEQIPNYISVIKYFELTTPMVIFLTVLDIKNYKIEMYEFEHMRERQNQIFTQDKLLLPEVYIDDTAIANLPLALKPLFDPIWNAAGHPQSPNFNLKGEWSIRK